MRFIESMFRHDMYNMIGFCPEEVLIRSLPYSLRNLVDTSDHEMTEIQTSLIDFAGRQIWGYTDPAGIVLSSGTESNEVAVHLANIFSGKKKIVIASSLCHSSIDNACAKLGLTLVKLPVSDKSFNVSMIDLEKALKLYEDKVAMVCLTFGTTLLGTIEDLEISNAVENYINANDIWLHIDAAYGGTIISLAKLATPEAKHMNTARSVTIDMHKFVGPIGCSILLLKNESDRYLLGEEAKYFSGHGTQLGTSRSAFACYASLATIEMVGYLELQKIALDCHEKAKSVAAVLQSNGFSMISAISSGVVPIHLSTAREIDYYQASLLKNGWAVSPIEFSCKSGAILFGLRIVVTPKQIMTKNILSDFCDKIISLAKYKPIAD